MSASEIIAKNENLHKITLEEKEGIDDYISQVKAAINIISGQINSMMANGDTIDDIKEILREDVSQLNNDLRRLENLSQQLQSKAEGYERYLNILRKAAR